MEICMFYKHAGSRKGSQPENQSSIKTLSSSSSIGTTSNEIFGKKTDIKKKSVLETTNEYNEPNAIISQNSPTTPPYQRLTNALQTDPRCAHEVALGRRVGLYRFCGDIGRGNFSKVKLAVHQLTRDKVAIKVVDRGGLDARALRMLSREVATLECVHHPNILRLFEVVETLGRVYLITEWIRGGEMYNHITQGGPLREVHASPLYKQLLLAVKHMHSLGFVHRDIKAENVLLVSENRLILADFGFSTELINGQNQKLDTFCGSPPYAAPELFSDDHYIGGPVDIWALGVLLYFMVVGNMPFRAPTVPSLRSAVLKGDYTLPGHISLPCQRLIQRILVHVPTQRPTIDEILSSQWIINPNLSLELMTREVNLHAKTIKKSNFWFRSKSRRLQRNFSIRERYLEITNKPPLQLSTKKSIDNINDNFLHPIELLHEHPQLFGDGSHGTIPRRSFFGGTLKKKVSPMEINQQQQQDNNKSPSTYRNGEIRTDDQKSIIIETPPPIQQHQQHHQNNYDDEKGKFIMLPSDTDDSQKLNPLELEAREILDKLGVSTEMLREAIKNGPRSDIIGAYRIVINRLQKQAWLAKRQADALSQLVDPVKNPKRSRGCTIL